MMRSHHEIPCPSPAGIIKKRKIKKKEKDKKRTKRKKKEKRQNQTCRNTVAGSEHTS